MIDLGRCLHDANYRHWVTLWLRHRRTPRYTAGKLHAFGLSLDVTDHRSVVFQFLDIFANHDYCFDSESRSPVIVDVGANVGVSVLYFCRTFADPEIHAFEPDPVVFDALTANVARNAGNKRIHLHRRAAFDRNTVVSFVREGADGGNVLLTEASTAIAVTAIDLREYLSGLPPIDLLKIDIEGAEMIVVPHCGPVLPRVKRIFIEYHSRVGDDQALPELLALLKAAGFRLHLQSAVPQHSPFRSCGTAVFDNQINIFGYRTC